jgi:hypothetical protein
MTPTSVERRSKPFWGLITFTSKAWRPGVCSLHRISVVTKLRHCGLCKMLLVDEFSPTSYGRGIFVTHCMVEIPPSRHLIPDVILSRYSAFVAAYSSTLLS